MSNLASFSSQLDLLESERRYLEMANHILSMMVRNVDLSSLAGKIIKFLAIPYPPCKKVMYSFLAKYSNSISNLSILATNSLLKDFQDPNPFIRGLVVKTVTHIPCLFELAFQLLPQALCDSSAYVRCTAASASSLIIDENNVKENQDIIDKLYEMIRDPDPTVVCGSLAALDEILISDGGVVINSKITFYLLSRVAEFTEFNVSVIYVILKKYHPKNSEELLAVLNSLDEKLLDENPAVFSLAADLSMGYIRQLEKGFSGDIIRQVFPHIRSLLLNSSAEMLAGILEMVERYLPEHKEIFTTSYKLFFCRFCDSTTVKIKKLSILPHLIDTNNVLDITEELLLHCCDGTNEVSCQAVNSFAEVISSNSEAKSFVGTFVSFMDLEHNGLRERILSSLSKVNLTELPSIKNCVVTAISIHAKNLSSLQSKLSLLKCIADYGEDIVDSPYIIEHMMNDELNLNDEQLMCTLLMTAVKLFLKRPGEMHLVLMNVFQCARNSSCPLVKKQVNIYYHILKDTILAKKVMQIHNKPLKSN